MRCPKCQSTAVQERSERTAQGYRRFRCLDCAKQFNERSGGLLNRTQHPSDVIALVVLAYLVFDTLYGVTGPNDGFRAMPQMAAGHTVDDDGRTWRIKLREGLVFH